MIKCLMLGCGHAKPARRVYIPGTENEEVEWTTLDMNTAAKPDILYDLNNMHKDVKMPIGGPVFDEIHAYEVLEHIGTQGDFRAFFADFRELWRVLKPNGILVGTSPSQYSPWCWGDPGHTRVISPEALSFLERAFYDQLGKTPASDYRAFIAPCYWKILHSNDTKSTYEYVLQKAE